MIGGMSTNWTGRFAVGFSALALLIGAGAAFGQSGPQLHMQEVFPAQPAPQLHVQDTFPTPAGPSQLIMEEAFPIPLKPALQRSMQVACPTPLQPAGPRAVEAPRSAPVFVARQKTVLRDERGGRIKDHQQRFQMLAERGDDIAVCGVCMSACTLVLAHTPKDRLCFGKFARLGFHLAGDPNGSPGLGLLASQLMIDSYPDDIQAWLYAKGGLRELSTNFWIMWAPELWEMGYHRCDD
jgi:hypothetical protein